jgi:hypothetical protein
MKWRAATTNTSRAKLQVLKIPGLARFQRLASGGMVVIVIIVLGIGPIALISIIGTCQELGQRHP